MGKVEEVIEEQVLEEAVPVSDDEEDMKEPDISNPLEEEVE